MVCVRARWVCTAFVGQTHKYQSVSMIVSLECYMSDKAIGSLLVSTPVPPPGVSLVSPRVSGKREPGSGPELEAPASKRDGEEHVRRVW